VEIKKKKETEGGFGEHVMQNQLAGRGGGGRAQERTHECRSRDDGEKLVNSLGAIKNLSQVDRETNVREKLVF